MIDARNSFLAIRRTVPEASELLPICQELLPLHTSLYMYLGNEKKQKRNQSPHQNLTPSHQIFHVATFVHLAWGTERGADRTWVGAWIPPFINLYRFESTSSGVFGFGLLELCVQDTVNIYVNEALSFEPQISIFRNTEFILRMQWTFNPLCSSVDFIHSRPAQRSVPRPHCSTRSVECRCHLDRMEISNHGVSI